MPLVHDSWMSLKPKKIEGWKEPFEDYYSRIGEKADFSHIPKEVFMQWIYEHHDNDYMAKNYGWFDYEKVRFDLVQWETAAFRNLYVIGVFVIALLMVLNSRIYRNSTVMTKILRIGSKRERGERHRSFWMLPL